MADMLTMNQPPLTQHISIPKDMSQLSCEAFTAGIVEGVLDGLDVVSHTLFRILGLLAKATSQPESRHTQSEQISTPNEQ
jgi:hypothetical protein